jgi:transposase
MRAFSNDLRERIVAAVQRGEHTLRQLAALFMVDVSLSRTSLYKKMRK